MRLELTGAVTRFGARRTKINIKRQNQWKNSLRCSHFVVITRFRIIIIPVDIVRGKWILLTTNKETNVHKRVMSVNGEKGHAT